MSVLEIPLAPTLPAYTEQVTLDGAQCTLRFRWNGRLGAWFVELYDVDETLLVPPRRVVVDWILNRQFRHVVGVPAGALMAFDTTQRHADPIVGELGERVLVLYADRSELP